MVVYCAATTGYKFTFDARHVWMHQKRIQGSHFANTCQANKANRLLHEEKIDPCMSEVFPWDQVPAPHMRMHRNDSPPGKMVVLVGAPRRGLTNFRETLEAAR
jgi:crotonyl-CoA carboxylase/reductase